MNCIDLQVAVRGRHMKTKKSKYTFGTFEKDLALAKLSPRNTPAGSIVGRLKSLHVFPPRLLLLHVVTLPLPLQLRVGSTCIDSKIVLFILK